MRSLKQLKPTRKISLSQTAKFNKLNNTHSLGLFRSNKSLKSQISAKTYSAKSIANKKLTTNLLGSCKKQYTIPRYTINFNKCIFNTFISRSFCNQKQMQGIYVGKEFIKIDNPEKINILIRVEKDTSQLIWDLNHKRYFIFDESFGDYRPRIFTSEQTESNKKYNYLPLILACGFVIIFIMSFLSRVFIIVW